MESQKLSDFLAGAKKDRQEDHLSAEELYKKALEALESGNMHEAVDLLKTASSMGYANASCELGLISSIAGHEDIGLDWYRLAAEQGNSYAQSKVADAEIKAENYPEAIKWYRKSAEQGLPNAILKLALCYDQGQYIEEDKAVAAKWFRKLAEMQDVTGQYKVYSKHYPFEKEATHLQSIAQYCLGLSYLNGEGVEKNIEEAKKWIRLAAEKGYEDYIFDSVSDNNSLFLFFVDNLLEIHLCLHLLHNLYNLSDYYTFYYIFDSVSYNYSLFLFLVENLFEIHFCIYLLHFVLTIPFLFFFFLYNHYIS